MFELKKFKSTFCHFPRSVEDEISWGLLINLISEKRRGMVSFELTLNLSRSISLISMQGRITRKMNLVFFLWGRRWRGGGLVGGYVLALDK